MTDDCPKCGTVTEGIGGVGVAFRGFPPGNGGPPIKPAPMPHAFKCEACGHLWVLR